MFISKIQTPIVDLQLDFKATGVSETDRTVKKARAFFMLLRKNVTRLRLLPDFATIKDVTQTKDTMEDWLNKSKLGESATYYMYPHGSDTCVGCIRLKRQNNMVETAFWTDKDETGKGYMQAGAQAVEKMLFENGAKEIVRRVYVENPCHDAVKHNILKAGYVPCEFKGVSYKNGDEKVFETFHKTSDMYYGNAHHILKQKTGR